MGEIQKIEKRKKRETGKRNRKGSRETRYRDNKTQRNRYLHVQQASIIIK